MQVREGVQASSVLARKGMENSGFCMQSHAAYAWLFFLKDGYFRGVLCGFFAGLRGPVSVKVVGTPG
jgi:hypothetical protein